MVSGPLVYWDHHDKRHKIRLELTSVEVRGIAEALGPGDRASEELLRAAEVAEARDADRNHSER